MLRRHSERPDYADLAARQVVEVRSPRGRSRYWFWLLLVMLGFAFVVGVIYRDYRRGMLVDSSPDNAVLAAQSFVKADLGAGVVTRFAPREWNQVERDGEQFVVSGWVEAIPKAGYSSSITYDYICTVSQHSNGEWYPSDINLRPQ